MELWNYADIFQREKNEIIIKIIYQCVKFRAHNDRRVKHGNVNNM